MTAESQLGLDLGQIRKTSWKAYAVRFVFGGVITAVVGIVGKLYGPVVAGLFLAFPAILPASLTLISRQDGENAAGRDAVGAVMGSIGLAGFGLVIWLGGPHYSAWVVLLIAAVVWFAVSAGIWLVYCRAGGHG